MRLLIVALLLSVCASSVVAAEEVIGSSEEDVSYQAGEKVGFDKTKSYAKGERKGYRQNNSAKRAQHKGKSWGNEERKKRRDSSSDWKQNEASEEQMIGSVKHEQKRSHGKKGNWKSKKHPRAKDRNTTDSKTAEDQANTTNSDVEAISKQ